MRALLAVCRIKNSVPIVLKPVSFQCMWVIGNISGVVTSRLGLHNGLDYVAQMLACLACWTITLGFQGQLVMLLIHGIKKNIFMRQNEFLPSSPLIFNFGITESFFFFVPMMDLLINCGNSWFNKNDDSRTRVVLNCDHSLNKAGACYSPPTAVCVCDGSDKWYSWGSGSWLCVTG